MKLNFIFNSSSHIRYEGGVPVSGLKVVANRAIKVEPNIEEKEGCTVTILNNEGNHPLWGNNVQMAPKQMKIVTSTQEKTELRGWGEDPRAYGNPAGRFSNYGITIYHHGEIIDKIVLHMHDRRIDIEYFK